MRDQLLNQTYHYLDRRGSLRDLETWLLSNLQVILDGGDETAIEMANQMDADLIELGEGIIDEATLGERLESYARLLETVPHVFSETERTAIDHATVDVETLKSRLEVPGSVVDLRLAHVFA